ncbi:MAG: hypothetical protein H8D43_04610, partial [Chloroflexi bacterium]|nr:hypothetical protein [Chloroflexota bacterium]
VSERAFDRRLDWLERTMKTLNAVKYLNGQVIEDIRLNNFPSLVEDSSKMIQMQEELVLHLSEAELFASRSAYDAARSLRYELSEKMYGDPTGRYSQLMNAKQIDEEKLKSALNLAMEMCQLLQPLYDAASNELSKDARGHLKLKPLKVANKYGAQPKKHSTNT